MIDLVLFVGRIALVAILYLFLFVVMKTGIGLVKGQRKDPAIWCVDVDKGPRQLRGLHVDMLGPVVVGRSPSSDIVISTNGTLVNGRSILDPVTLRDGDEVQVGDVVMRVSRR